MFSAEKMKEQYGKRLQGMIFHCDIGSQHIGEAIKSVLKSCGITQCFSSTGHCFDNVRMESFWAILKKEKIYRIAAYKLTREQIKKVCFLSITTGSRFTHQIRTDFRRSSTETAQTAAVKPHPDGGSRICFSEWRVSKRGKTDSILRIFQI